MDNIYSSMLFQYNKNPPLKKNSPSFRFFSREVKAKMPNEFTFLRMKSYKYNASSFPFYQHMVIASFFSPSSLTNSKVPKQSNGHDCGLYFLQFMEMFSEDETYIMNRIEVAFFLYLKPNKSPLGCV